MNILLASCFYHCICKFEADVMIWLLLGCIFMDFTSLLLRTSISECTIEKAVVL